MSGVRLIRRANTSGPVQLRRSLRDRCLMWGRFAVAGLAGGTAFALGTPSLRDTVAVAIASAGVASLGMERLHHVFKSRTVGASAIRSHVSQNPAMSYFVPLPGVVAIIYASSQGVWGQPWPWCAPLRPFSPGSHGRPLFGWFRGRRSPTA